VSFAKPSVVVATYVPPWLRHAFLTVLVVHDLLLIFAGAWGLAFQPAALQAAPGPSWLDDVWGWLFLLGGVLSLGGALLSGRQPHTDGDSGDGGWGLVTETIGCVLVWGGYEVLAVGTTSAGLFGPYSVAGGIAFAAAGISSLRRIGRVWAGAFLRGRG
jgi:hypothetical protein